MKNTIISIIIFLLLILSLLFLDKNVSSIYENILEHCNKIEELLLKENKDLAYEQADKLFEHLKDNAPFPSIYLNHADYDNLMNEAIKLTLYIQNEDKSESSATLHVIKYNAQHLKELQKINFKNIF